MAINTVEKEEKNTEEDCKDPINLQTKPCTKKQKIFINTVGTEAQQFHMAQIRPF